MKRKYFGTDGIRGTFGGPVINEAFARRLGAGAAIWLSGREAALQVLIGRDTRRSGEVLERALVAGLVSRGATVRLAGILPTPALAGAMVGEGASLAVMITASHNPACDNGIKFFTTGGTKLTDDEEAALEAAIPAEAPTGVSIPFAPLAAGALAAYCDRAMQILPAAALDGWSIVLDTANGATCESSARVLSALGGRLTRIGDHPDGENINLDVGSEHPALLAQAVVRAGARVGIAHDGDGDRCVLCDETGDVLDGDEIVTILALRALGLGKLPGQTVVVTVQSNLGVDAAIRKAGGVTLRTQVGDRYVLEGMRANGARLGGESSGHIVSFDESTTGDGLVAALKVLEVMVATGKPLSELRRGLVKFPQATGNLRVKAKKDLDTLVHLPVAIAALEASLGAEGRVLVRYSGTEPKLRFLVEGPSERAVEDGMSKLIGAARLDLSVVEDRA